MRLTLALFLAVLRTTHAAATEPAHGDLCISGTPCRPIVCGQAFEPAAEPRAYTFLRSGSSRHDFGVIAAGATRVTCDPAATVELRLEVPALPRGGIVRLAMTTQDKTRWWNLQFSARELGSRIAVSGPA